MKRQYICSIGNFAIHLVLLIFCPAKVLADNSWTYQQETDKSSNRTYTFAQSPMPAQGMYDNMRLQIICNQNKLQFAIEAENLIASQDRYFDVEYQVDKRTPVTLQMKTFPDSKRKGYTFEHAKRITDDMLTGQTVFLRITTMIKKLLSSSISLNGAEDPIKHVLADCGFNNSINQNDNASYNLKDFEADFSKLNPKQQEQVLEKIKTMMLELR
jgi:hypothetical protein